MALTLMVVVNGHHFLIPASAITGSSASPVSERPIAWTLIFVSTRRRSLARHWECKADDIAPLDPMTVWTVVSRLRGAVATFTRCHLVKRDPMDDV